MAQRVSTPVILVIVVCVVHAQTTLTTTRRTIPSSGHGERMGGSEESRGSSGEARSSGVRSDKAALDRTCYSISPTREYSFSVWPPPRSNGYVYNRGQNVTLTCEVKNATSVTQQPYVFITSCMNCSGWIVSEAARGKVELVLDGRTTSISNGDSGCQFSCWRYDNTCNTVPRPDLFRPRPIDCPLAAFGGALKTITFGELPRSEGVRCVSENWQGLRCTWTLTTGTQTWSRYTADGCLVSYSYPCDNMAARNNCTGPRTHVTTSIPVVSQDAGHIITQLLVPSGHFRQGQDYSVSFLIKSYYGDVRTTHNVTTDLKIVKFDPVKNLQVTSDDGNSSVLHVQWDIPEPAQSIAEVAHGLECRLRVVATSVPWLRYNATVPVSAEDCKRHHATVAGLHPRVTYDVHVQFRPKDVLYWSDEAKSSGTTMEDVPSRAPEVTSGGYVTWSCDTGQCITVYWKGLAPQYQNGNLTEYLLSVYPHQTQRKLEGELHNHSAVHSSSADTRSLTVDRVNFTSARACVSAATSVGLSPVSNCITVLPRFAPGVPSSPQEVTVDHMTSSEDYIVRWTSGNSSSATADYVTVFWCWGNMNRTNVHCKSDMNWIDVTVTPSTATHTAIFAMKADKMADPRPAGDDGVTWQFGVASVVGNISHGITWNKCSFDERGQVLPPVFGVENIRATSFTVTWIVSCDAHFSFARPLRYFIYYSQSTESHRHTTCTEGNRTEVNPKLGRNRLVIANLKPGATYSLCMAVMSYHGGNDVSAPTTVTLMQESHNGKDRRPLTIIIVMSALLSLSFVSLSVWLFRRKLKRTSRKFSPFFIYPEMAPKPTETTPAGSVNLTTDRNLPSTKTPSPCQRQTGTPQTIPDEAAWTGWAATTGTPDAAERPGKGAADRCLKNTAAEARNPQSPTEISVNTERCSWTQSSTVDKLPTCKTDCVGEPPMEGLGYDDKPSIDETGHAGNPASGDSVFFGKTSTGESGYVTVGKTATAESEYVTVGKTSTSESWCMRIGKTPTGKPAASAIVSPKHSPHQHHEERAANTVSSPPVPTTCPDYNANIGLCLNLHDKPSSYVSISENHDLQEHKRQTPGAHPESLEADNFHTLDTEAEDISEVTPAGVKPCHSQDPTMVSARDDLSWGKEHTGSLPFPVEGGFGLKLISEFRNPDSFTRPLPAETNMPLLETDQWSDDTLPKLSGLNETSFAEPTPYVRSDTDSGTSFERECVGADAPRFSPEPECAVVGRSVPLAEPDVSRDTRQEGTGVRRQEGTGVRRQEGTGVPRQEGTGVPRQEGTGVPRQQGTEARRQEGTGVRRQEGTGVPRQEGTGVPRQGTGVDLYVFIAPDETGDTQQEVTGLGVAALAEPRVLRDAEPETTTRRQPARSLPTAVESFPRTSVLSPCEREQSEVLRHGHDFEPSFSTPYEGIGTGGQSGPSLTEQTENCLMTVSANFSHLWTDTMPGVSTGNSNMPQKSRPHGGYVPWSSPSSPAPQNKGLLQQAMSTDSGYTSQETVAN